MAVAYFYQWQVNTGTGWVNIPGATLSTVPVTGYSTGDQIRLLVRTTEDGCPSVGYTSNALTMPATGLAAVMLFDTRLWAGGATLPNLGSAGSRYDLDVLSYGADVQYAFRNTAPTAPTWAEWGGNADSAGWIAVYAIGYLNRVGNGGIESDFIINNGGGGPNKNYLSNVNFTGNDELWVSDDDIFASIFRNDTVYSDPNSYEMDWEPQEAGSGGPNVDQSRTVVVMSFDAIAGTYGIWVNGVEITNSFLDYSGAPISNTSPTINDVFMYIGESQPSVTSGKWPYGTYAMGLYRGPKPSPADLATFQTYYGEPVLTPTPLSYIGSAAQSDSSGYHTASITAQLPTGAVGDLRFFIVCGENPAYDSINSVPPGGWRYAAATGTPDNTGHVYLFWKIKESGDTDTITIPFYGSNPSTNAYHAMGYCFRGADPVDPINSLIARMNTTGTVTLPQATTTCPCTLLMFVSAIGGGGSFSTSTSGWTELQDGTSNTSIGGPHAVYQKTALTHGDYTGPVVVPSGTTGMVAGAMVGIRLANSQLFTYTGVPQTFTVPAGVTSVLIDAYGAEGGDNAQTTPAVGGLGGRSMGRLTVTPGQTLTVTVGGKGGQPGFTRNSYNGGGYSQSPGGSAVGEGGGATDIRSGGTALSDRILVAGGGGGAAGGYSSPAENDDGGAGGGANHSGINSISSGSFAGWDGGGATVSAGGTAGSTNMSIAATAGTLGQGGLGCSSGVTLGGGGGGGGYYGGGGGGGYNTPSSYPFGGGGGGSGYASGAFTEVVGATGVWHGHGRVVISWA